MAKATVTLKLELSEETRMKVQDLQRIDPDFVRTFVLLSLYELVREYDVMFTPIVKQPKP